MWWTKVKINQQLVGLLGRVKSGGWSLDRKSLKLTKKTRSSHNWVMYTSKVAARHLMFFKRASLHLNLRIKFGGRELKGIWGCVNRGATAPRHVFYRWCRGTYLSLAPRSWNAAWVTSRRIPNFLRSSPFCISRLTKPTLTNQNVPNLMLKKLISSQFSL